MTGQEGAAERHLAAQFPRLVPLFEALGPIVLPQPKSLPVAEALVRVVVGQMLSRQAAATISGRVEILAAEAGARSWELPPEILRQAGLSTRKCRTVGLIGEVCRQDPERLESWRQLPFAALRREVQSFWGLSDWTAAMLAIFYFGHTDVFPLSDGTLKRAVDLTCRHLLAGEALDHALASPYGTHLAMTLWQSIDAGFWKAERFSGDP